MGLCQENEERWPEEPNPDWEVVNCKHGWIFDKSEYENTLVTEVRYEYAHNIKKHSPCNASFHETIIWNFY
jgi:hypothetical protein